MENPFTAEQIAALDKPLPPPLISERKGTGKMLSYIEGHDAIDQANRIFGYGNWSYRTLSCEQTVLIDPATGEPVGIAYKAKVELTVAGTHGSIIEVGSQPVAAWNVNDVVMGRRKKGDDSPIQAWEKATAQRTIVEAHEHAEKGAVTDAMKRALRTFGNQFGNGLYGDGQVDLSEQTIEAATSKPRVVVNAVPAQSQVADAQIEQLKADCEMTFPKRKGDARLFPYLCQNVLKEWPVTWTPEKLTKMKHYLEHYQAEAKTKQEAA